MSNKLSIDKAGHIKRIDEAIHELSKFDSRTRSPAPTPHQYIGTVIDNTICLLAAPANALDSGHRRCVMGNDNNWLSLMQSVHRSFLSSIHTSTEAGLVEISKENSFSVEIKINEEVTELIERIKTKIDSHLIESELVKIEKKLTVRKPSFDDYLGAVLKNTILSVRRKVVWRKFFKALSIVRNKVSHSDTSLSQHEQKTLKEGGFETLISKEGRLQVNPRMYEQICQYVLQFFDEVVSLNNGFSKEQGTKLFE